MHLGVVVVAQVAPGLILGDGGEGSWHYCRSMQDQGEPRTRSDDHGGHGGHGGGDGVDGDDCGGGGLVDTGANGNSDHVFSSALINDHDHDA